MVAIRVHQSLEMTTEAVATKLAVLKVFMHPEVVILTRNAMTKQMIIFDQQALFRAIYVIIDWWVHSGQKMAYILRKLFKTHLTLTLK